MCFAGEPAVVVVFAPCCVPFAREDNQERDDREGKVDAVHGFVASGVVLLVGTTGRPEVGEVGR